MGMLAALHEANSSGEGQVVDCAMTDGAASLMSMFYGFTSSKIWQNTRGSNLLDTGAHFYDVYETKDKKYVSIGSIEPQFYALLLEKANIQDPDFDDQMNREKWPLLKDKIEDIFQTKTRDEWCNLMEGTDVCFSPVLSINEAPKHPHNIDRETFVEIDGVVQPNVAPRFSRTESKINGPSAINGEHNETALMEWGISEEKVKSIF